MEPRKNLPAGLIVALCAAAAVLISACANRQVPVAAAPKPPEAVQAPVAKPPAAKPAAPKSIEPRAIDVEIRADQILNVDSRGRSAPLVVRIYELRAPLKFQAADFFALFDRDQAALGEDLIKREDFQLRPGESRKVSREIGADARALGVLAAYRDLEHANWRALIALPDPATDSGSARIPVNIGLGAREVRVTGR